MVAAAWTAGALSAASGGETVWSGVYTSAQALQGKAAYSNECGRCHRDDLSGYDGVLIGTRFLNDWREDTLNSFFKIVKQTMPRDAPSSLSDSTYLDIVAYILQANEFPAGGKTLTADALAGIRVEGKQGPESVPDFSLVDVVGCLSLRADNTWMVTQASEPVRTRNPGLSTGVELDSVKTKPLGTHTYQLLDSGTAPTALRGHKVEAKGFLIRQSSGDRINPSSVQNIAESCALAQPGKP